MRSSAKSTRPHNTRPQPIPPQEGVLIKTASLGHLRVAGDALNRCRQQRKTRRPIPCYSFTAVFCMRNSARLKASYRLDYPLGKTRDKDSPPPCRSNSRLISIRSFLSPRESRLFPRSASKWIMDRPMAKTRSARRALGGGSW